MVLGFVAAYCSSLLGSEGGFFDLLFKSLSKIAMKQPDATTTAITDTNTSMPFSSFSCTTIS
jgi:hypothetical protein